MYLISFLNNGARGKGSLWPVQLQKAKNWQGGHGLVLISLVRVSTTYFETWDFHS